MLALKRLPEKHTLIKLAAQTNKRTQKLIQTGRRKRQGGTNNNMYSASASGDTVINKSTLCVQPGLKYNNLCGKCPESSLQSITSGHKTTTIFVFILKDWDTVLLVRLLGKRFHS